MKSLTLLMAICLLCISHSTLSQTYDGPAAFYVKNHTTMKDYAEQLIVKRLYASAATKAEQMDKNILKINEKDPSYDVSTMTAEIADLKQRIAAAENQESQAMADQEAARKSGYSMDKLLRDLFMNTTLDVGDSPSADEKMDTFKSNASEYLELSKQSPEFAGKADYLGYVNKELEYLPIYIQKVEAWYEGAVESDGISAQLKTLSFYTLYWETAQAIYPEQNYATALQKLAQLRTKLGSEEDLRRKISANNATQINERKVPVAAQSNPELEQKILHAFNLRFAKDYSGPATQIILVQSNWSYERNAFSGEIINRSISATATIKGNDGKCYLLDRILYIQQNVNGQFQDDSIASPGFEKEINCARLAD